MGKEKLIRDVVYDYVSFTELEKTIIEHPSFQRLRFVYQNSSAFYTYPSNQLTRYTHSLGVAHLGGLMFMGAIHNNCTKSEYIKKLLDLSKELIIESCNNNNVSYDDLKQIWFDEKNKLGNLCEYSRYIEFGDYDFKEQVFIINVMWQSLRFTCLTHDIGHFPFSHIFEYGLTKLSDNNSKGKNAVQEFINQCFRPFVDIFENTISDLKEKNISFSLDTMSSPFGFEQIHELLGAYLIENIKPTNNLTTSFNVCKFIGMSFFIEKNEKLEKHNEIRKFFKLIVSSELDADRLDYTLRDAISSGLDLGNFDYIRLINNLLITLKDHKIYIVTNDRAMSSIEQFFNFRYTLYEYVYYHHNVAKYDGIASEIIKEIFITSINKSNNAVLEEMIRFKGIDESGRILPLLYKDGELCFSIYDDSWFRSLLTGIYLKEEIPESLKILIETFLYRKNENTISFIKRDQDFTIEVLERVRNNKNIDNNIRNNCSYKEFVGMFYKSNLYISNNDSPVNHKEVTQSKKEHIKQLFGDLKDELLNQDIVLIEKSIKPKLVKKDYVFVFKESKNELIPILQASNYLDTINHLVDNSFNYYIGAVLKKGKNVNIFYDKVDDFLAQYFTFANYCYMGKY